MAGKMGSDVGFGPGASQNLSWGWAMPTFVFGLCSVSQAWGNKYLIRLGWASGISDVVIS